MNLYNQLFVMSIVAGGLYLILKLFSAATMKYFTASWHYCTYAAVYMFLLLPYHKLVSLFSFSQKVKTELSLLALPSIVSLPSSSSNDFVAVTDKPDSISTLNLDFLPYFLMAGTLAFITIILIQNIRLYRRIFGVCRLTDEAQFQDILVRCKEEMGISNHVPVYISPYASTPFLYGVLKPRIVLPDTEFTAEELRYVFQHELTHWKRHDPWLKCLMLFINAVHWYNPLAYIARSDIDRFCELSCDERVVISMNNEERRRYCELMLGVLWKVTGHNVKLLSAFSDKRKQLEGRVNMIMKTEGLKSKKWIRMLALAMTLALLMGAAVTAYAVDSVVPVEAKEGHAAVQPVPVGKNIPKEGPSTSNGEGEIGIANIQLISNVLYNGITAYEKTFALSPSNGKQLNVWVQNNSTSKTVKYKVIHLTGNTDFGYKDVGPGQQLTRSLYMPDGSGLSGDWKVYVTSDDGHQMDLNISAGIFRQANQ